MAVRPPLEINVVFLPRDLRAGQLPGRAVVVFDVLRATTSMTAALAAGVREIHLFGDLASAAAAARDFPGSPLLCGEENCLPPTGFDLGNSPGAFDPAVHGGRTAFMSTTNGTRALLAARGADVILAGALVNAGAVARALTSAGLPVTLLCAGTDGEVAMEDVLGAGAVVDALLPLGCWLPADDTGRIAHRLFLASRADLRSALADARGGRNVIAAGLAADIDFAAQFDVVDVVGAVRMPDFVLRPWHRE